MGKITVEVKINTFGNMLYSLNHPNASVMTDGASCLKFQNFA